MSKPPVKGTAATPPQTRGATSKLHQTRSATTATGKVPQNNNQAENTESQSQLSEGHDPVNSPLKELVRLLTQFANIYKLDNVAKLRMEEIISFTKDAAEKERKGGIASQNQNIVSEIHAAILVDLHSMYKAIEGRITGIQETANATLSGVDKALKAADAAADASKDLKGDTTSILSKLGQVTNVTDKIASTTQSYKDVLVARQAPSLRSSVDPKVLGDMDRKAKQILVDIFEEEGNSTLDKSLTDLIAKANEALDSMSDASKPANAKVESVFKTRKNAILLTLNSRETADWVREPGNEETFANAFSKGAHIREREYNLVAPRVPLTFEPDNKKHLREIEESNSLPTHVIRKARWIKPAERRRVGQTHAYAIITVTSVDTANKLIKDGLGICSSFIRPSKLKHEPTQCMKCRRWGHFADKCLQMEDTCGTCGGKHRTSACTNKDKRHCVSCGSNSHASWDRTCPDFIRRCAFIDERNPDNSMPFFPAEQDWTLVTRPSRVPMAERFPATYAVNSLPQTTSRGNTHRKGNSRAGLSKPSIPNPNRIPLPQNSKYGTREPGELADDGEGIPEWAREPLYIDSEPRNQDGEVTLQSETWI